MCRVPRTDGHSLLVPGGLSHLIVLYMTHLDLYLLPTLITKGCGSIVGRVDLL